MTSDEMLAVADSLTEAAKVPEFLRVKTPKEAGSGFYEIPPSGFPESALRAAGVSFTFAGQKGVQDSSEAQETTLQEAQRLTHGPRQADYSHPFDDYTRTAELVNAALRHKLRVNLDPEDVTIIMCLVKISRQMHKPKRDNMVDLAGYSWCTDEIIEERKRRAAAMNQVQSQEAQR